MTQRRVDLAREEGRRCDGKWTDCVGGGLRGDVKGRGSGKLDHEL